MSKKPAAALSANLVAVKGAALPAADMPGRATPAPTVAPVAPVAVTPEPVVVPIAPAKPSGPSKPAPEQEASAGQGEAGGQPLNFRVPDSFRRAFKVYAAKNGLKLNELLRLSFDAYRRQNGD